MAEAGKLNRPRAFRKTENSELTNRKLFFFILPPSPAAWTCESR